MNKADLNDSMLEKGMKIAEKLAKPTEQVKVVEGTEVALPSPITSEVNDLGRVSNNNKAMYLHVCTPQTVKDYRDKEIKVARGHKALAMVTNKMPKESGQILADAPAPKTYTKHAWFEVLMDVKQGGVVVASEGDVIPMYCN